MPLKKESFMTTLVRMIFFGAIQACICFSAFAAGPFILEKASGGGITGITTGCLIDRSGNVYRWTSRGVVEHVPGQRFDVSGIHSEIKSASESKLIHEGTMRGGGCMVWTQWTAYESDGTPIILGTQGISFSHRDGVDGLVERINAACDAPPMRP